jgi:multimeric flavodoxin WrbA
MKGITSDLHCKSIWRSQEIGASASTTLETEAPQKMCERVEDEMRSIDEVDTMIQKMKKQTKKKSVLIISGSRSSDGNTDAIVENLQDGLIDAGFHIENLSIRDLEFSKCTDCGKCRASGTCQFNDDLTKVMKTIENSDIFVFSLHFDGQKVNGFMRKFVERLNAYRNSDRVRLLKGKYALIVTTMEGQESTFETKKVTEFYTRYIHSLGIRILDMLIFDGLDLTGEIHERIDYLSRAYYAGRGLSILLKKYYMKKGMGRRCVVGVNKSRERVK